MINMKSAAAPRRAYRQSARAEAAEATGKRILDAFLARLADQWFDEITLDSLAAGADVSVQTILRRFGGKDGLIKAARDQLDAEISRRRATTPGDGARAIDQLAADYEISGDLVMRLLAQEGRYPAVRAVTDYGRAHHRNWLAQTFAPQLGRWSGAERTSRLDGLVAATDLYLWQLIRRDMRRPLAAYKKIVSRMIAGALAD